MFSTWNLIWFACALIFVLLLLKVPDYQSKEMVSFDPYAILELEPGATGPEVRRVMTRECSFYSASAAVTFGFFFFFFFFFLFFFFFFFFFFSSSSSSGVPQAQSQVSSRQE